MSWYNNRPNTLKHGWWVSYDCARLAPLFVSNTGRVFIRSTNVHPTLEVAFSRGLYGLVSRETPDLPFVWVDELWLGGGEEENRSYIDVEWFMRDAMGPSLIFGESLDGLIESLTALKRDAIEFVRVEKAKRAEEKAKKSFMR
jgi:hypothetical protein